ncbi:MAG TPA: YceI family protein [Polyangia bacterium]|jgi:polyisoprenoid-binding protein YceI|nr:YceI family protein [Polyangia bacterium]
MNTTTETATSRAAAPAAAAVATYDIDTAHATAGFKVRHLMLAHVRGHLGPVTGTVAIDERDITRSRVDVSVDARGLDSREPKRDEHLRSADFLDVANHPTVTFRSTRVEAPQGPDGDLRVTGDLTIRGVSRAVTLEVEALGPAVKDPWGNSRRGVSARARINRKDWGLNWNVAIEAGGVVVGEEVQIEIEAELIARKA